jgi:4-amino-4-deoxy-L-arabinose transferase-like glycosyltransferase
MGTEALSRASLRERGRVAWQRFGRRVASAGIPTWALVVGGLALLVRLPFLFGEHNVPPESDNEYYLYLADGLLQGDGFRDQHFWTPGYPAFLALLHLLPGRVEDAATIAQHLLGAALTVAILVAGWRYFGKAAALVAATFAAVTPVMVVHEHTILPDFVFGLLLLVGALTLAEAVRRRPVDLRLLVVTGVVFGAATWVKPAGQFLFAAAPLALLFATRNARQVLTGSAIVAVALLVTISPWLVRNTVKFGFPSMSNQGGRTLFFRVFDVDRMPIPLDQKHGPFAEAVRQGIAGQPDEKLTYHFHYDLIDERDATEEEATRAAQRLALVAIGRHPWRYSRGTWREVKRSVADLTHPVGSRYENTEVLLLEVDRTRPPFPKAATTAAWDGARVLTNLWWLLSLHTAAGLLTLLAGTKKTRNAAAALWSVWVAVAIGTAMAHGALWRYSIQLAPITFLLSSAGIVILASSVWRRLASQRGTRGA